MKLIQHISKTDSNQNQRDLSLTSFDINDFEKLLQKEDETFWLKKGEKKALKLFHEVAERVPAYKNFLKKNKINHEDIKTISDFKRVPITDKKNYIQAYSLPDRCWDGRLPASTLIAASSGTSGEPTFWPRAHQQDFEAEIIHELIYKYLFKVNKYKTLLVICFPMGVYVSGMATVLPSWLAATQHQNLTIATVGNNKVETLRLISSLKSEFEQIVLVGHPFFIKDVIETGKNQGIKWSDTKLRLMFCSGSFNETWRKYVMEKAELKESDYAHVLSTYGSSEMLLIGHETPLSIFSRVLMEDYSEMRTLLQEPQTIPNLFQYNPLIRYIENENNELIFTSASGLPLIRFNLHDKGEVITFEQMSNQILQIAPKWQKELKSLGEKYPMWRLPFVTLYGRSDYTIKFYAANIYPEHIQQALNQEKLIDKLTGKFIMTKGHLENMDEYLEIHIELALDVKTSEISVDDIESSIVEVLKKINMEYLFLTKHLEKNLRPQIQLHEYQDKTYFPAGLKPAYIK
ncbi:MAG: hypothetical protein K0S63_490 [Gammaproteobacteria bacterium]|jgi:phenylacetate-CoA ligase|nr:hypothetical protein [Gammaproteobacteria bacterium]